MRGFRSVRQALGFYFEQAERLASTASVDLRPRVQGLDSRGRAADVMAMYLSVDLCLGILQAEERETVALLFNRAAPRPDRDQSRIYHRAMVKLGKEMRRRQVVVSP